MSTTTFPNSSCRKPIGGNDDFMENRTMIGEISHLFTLASLSLPALAIRELGYAVGQEKFVRLYTRQNGK